MIAVKVGYAKLPAMSIVIVGACGTGKTTLASALQRLGYDVRTVAQEHSVVQDLWAHEGVPAALILLDASPHMISLRRQSEFPKWLYQQQQLRLRSAREHATLYLHTDDLSPSEVQQRALQHLQQLGIRPRYS